MPRVSSGQDVGILLVVTQTIISEENTNMKVRIYRSAGDGNFKGATSKEANFQHHFDLPHHQRRIIDLKWPHQNH